MKSYRFIVKGRVQGVFYRKNVSQNASKEGFKGYVANLNDGSVEACVSCAPEVLDLFISILKKGSPNSIVEQIIKSEIDDIFDEDFQIRY